ncbi:IS3 family transposase [Spirosoma sp. HMF4905]|uniref:IS3 family transposase n=1 Tax=Spirosoma arboris TaxID=2682092 RepID=A0A7K1SBL2_9BACT|nr:IS3 family transposase [Spirosoma arboris]
MAESFFKTLKSELVYQQAFPNRAMAKQAVFEYVEICGAARAVQQAAEAFRTGLSFPF